MLPGFAHRVEQNLDQHLMRNFDQRKRGLLNRLGVEKAVDNILKQSTDVVSVVVVR